MERFDGRLAVITGGGTGMGRELARQLAAEGCHVAICDVSEENMAKIFGDEDLTESFIKMVSPDTPWEVAAEINDVRHVRAAPPVDRLVVVSDDADVALFVGEQFDQFELDLAGVLELIDE